MKNVLLLLMLSFSILGFSQKVKFKKGKVLIDNVEFLNYEEEGLMTTYSLLEGGDFISVVSTYYEVRNDAYYTLKNAAASGMSPTTKVYVYTVKFIELDKELTTDLSRKDLMAAVFKNKIIGEDSSVNKEKVDLFITKYNNENLKLKIN
jgi:hypothetical protein